MNLLGEFERLLNWLGRHSTAALAFFGTLATALAGAFGPTWVEEIKERVEKQRARSELVVRVIDATSKLDPADPKTVLRFGIVADLVADNKSVFDLRIDAASERLKHLSEDLKRGSVGVLDTSIEHKEKEIADLTESSQQLRNAAATLKIEVATSTTASATANSEGQGPAAQKADSEEAGAARQQKQALLEKLEAMAARQEALIQELQRAREGEQQARTDFVKSIEDATRKRQEAEQLITRLDDLKKGFSTQVDSQKALASQFESFKSSLSNTVQAVGSRMQTDLSTLGAERDAIKAERLELANKSSLLAEQQTELNAQAARVAAQTCERTQTQQAVTALLNIPVRAAESPPGSGAIVLSLPYGAFDKKIQGTLGLVADQLLWLGVQDRQAQVRGYVFDKKGLRKVKDSVDKAYTAFNFLVTRSADVRHPVQATNISVATDSYPPDATAAKDNRIEIAISASPTQRVATK